MMLYRRGKMIALVLGVLLLLCSCYPAVNLPETNDYIGGIDPDDLPESSVEPESSMEPVSEEEKPEARYVDLEAMPKVSVDMETKYVFGDRTLILEDTLENELELLMYQLQYWETVPDFEQYKAMHGIDKAMQLNADNTEKNFNEGRYFTEYVFHEIRALPENEVLTLNGGYVGQDIAKKIDQYDFTEYAVVKIDFDMKHSEESLKSIPQLEDGRYVQYYLWAKTATVAEFKLYEVYWDE